MINLSKIITLGLISAVAFSSCKKFVDVNDNPNSIVNTRADFEFTNAQSVTYRNQISTNLNFVPGTWSGYYAHSTTFTGAGNEKTYTVAASDFQPFNGLYDNLFDYEYAKKNADKDGFSYLKEIAEIMQCYVFQQVVDIYGDVPYSSAFQGALNVTPAYTNQKTIYEDLVVRLDKVMASMSTSAAYPTDLLGQNADIMFKLNKNKWLRFANSVKLRILMRQSFMPGRDAYITTNINSTLANGYIQENVLVQPGYVKVVNQTNPFYAQFYTETNSLAGSTFRFRKMNKVMIDWLKYSTSTPLFTTQDLANADSFRLQSLAYPQGASSTVAITNNLDTYLGVPLGAQSGYSDALSSSVGPFIVPNFQTDPNSAVKAGMLMLKANSDFVQAEAAQRYGIAFPGGTAQQLYEAGILNSFRSCAAPSTTGIIANAGDAPALRYMARPIPNVGWAASTDKIRAILTQRWISLCHISGLEAWSDYRKSNGTASVSVPTSPRSTTADPSLMEPSRFPYPQTENDTNGSNVPSGQTLFTHLFWDVN